MCLKKGTTGEKSPQDTSKTMAGSNKIDINTMFVSKKFNRGNVTRISQTIRNLMKKQQNVKKL